MARLYEWERWMTDIERATLVDIDEELEPLKNDISRLHSYRDTIRRKCVQRARNAQAKLDRAAYRARTTAQHEEGGA